MNTNHKMSLADALAIIHAITVNPSRKSEYVPGALADAFQVVHLAVSAEVFQREIRAAFQRPVPTTIEELMGGTRPYIYVTGRSQLKAKVAALEDQLRHLGETNSVHRAQLQSHINQVGRLKEANEQLHKDLNIVRTHSKELVDELAKANAAPGKWAVEFESLRAENADLKDAAKKSAEYHEYASQSVHRATNTERHILQLMCDKRQLEDRLGVVIDAIKTHRKGIAASFGTYGASEKYRAANAKLWAQAEK